MLLHGGEPRRWPSRRQLVRGFRNRRRVLGPAALFMPPSEGQEPRALTDAAQAIEGRKWAETTKDHPDARIVHNLSHGDLARKAGRFPVTGNYTTNIETPTTVGWGFFLSASCKTPPARVAEPPLCGMEHRHKRLLIALEHLGREHSFPSFGVCSGNDRTGV